MIALRLVADTSFYIAASLQESYARTYLTNDTSKTMPCKFFTSEAILLETQEKLENSKFDLSRSEIVEAILNIRNQVEIVHPRIKIQAVRDQDDDKILECAVEAKADIIVSLDRDLLSMKEFQGVKIIHPSALKYLLPLA